MEHTQQTLHVRALIYAGTIFLGVLSILAIVATIHVAKDGQRGNENTISVEGMAEVTAVPDVAEFSFTVKETAKTTDAAQDVISEKVSTILDGLDELDIDDKDIKTQSYAIYPKYEWVRVDRQAPDTALDGTIFYPGNDNRQVQTGFDVSQNVSVKVRDFEVVPQVLTLFADAGVENLNGPNFTIDEPDALEEEARKLAIEEAQAKAKRLADDLGVRLGDVVSFNENGGGYPMPYYAKAEMDMAVQQDGALSSAPELPAGENTIRSNVSIIYTIK